LNADKPAKKTPPDCSFFVGEQDKQKGQPKAAVPSQNTVLPDPSVKCGDMRGAFDSLQRAARSTEGS
jgi:hypothetical protein